MDVLVEVDSSVRKLAKRSLFLKLCFDRNSLSAKFDRHFICHFLFFPSKNSSPKCRCPSLFSSSTNVEPHLFDRNQDISSPNVSHTNPLRKNHKYTTG